MRSNTAEFGLKRVTSLSFQKDKIFKFNKFRRKVIQGTFGKTTRLRDVISTKPVVIYTSTKLQYHHGMVTGVKMEK